MIANRDNGRVWRRAERQHLGSYAVGVRRLRDFPDAAWNALKVVGKICLIDMQDVQAAASLALLRAPQQLKKALAEHGFGQPGRASPPIGDETRQSALVLQQSMQHCGQMRCVFGPKANSRFPERFEDCRHAVCKNRQTMPHGFEYRQAEAFVFAH